MAAEQNLAPLYQGDLPACTLAQLRELAWTYYGDDDAMQLVLAEYSRRGIDPYA